MSTIYTGTWIDHSSGLLHGSKLTTTSPTALCLVSFLAIFILITSAHFWGILRFLLHQLRVVRSPQDGLYYQEQVLLRNSRSPSAALWDFCRIGWAWRGRAEYSVARVLPLIVLAGLQAGVFLVAAVFSSGTFEISNEVLVQSESCGYLEYPEIAPGEIEGTTRDWNLLNAVFAEERTKAQQSAAYAKSCYGESVGAECGYFMAPRLMREGYNGTLVGCPFDDALCIRGGLEMDSGIIYSDSDLGINSKPEDRLGYRRVTTCAPIMTDGYAQWSQNAQGVDQFLMFYYGSYSSPEAGEELPVTFSYDAFSANYTANAYPLNYQMAALNNSALSTFSPISGLSRDDGDVTLLFMLNNARFTAPVYDLFFNATNAVPDVYGLGEYMYTADSPVSVMGCVEQHQFCTAEDICSPLSGISALNSSTETTYADKAQNAIADVLKHSIISTLLSDMVFNLGSAALAASSSIDGAATLLSAPLPDTQWTTEILTWHTWTLAHLQTLLTSIAAGPALSTSTPYITPPSPLSTSAFNICTAQKVHSPAHFTFALSPLFLLIAIGLAIILTSLFLPRLTGLLQRLTGLGLQRKEDWEMDHVLQLQRLAYEGAKLGSWSAREGGVPTTLQTTGMEGVQKFGRPGRVVKAYEPLELAERGLGMNMSETVGTGYDGEMQGLASPRPARLNSINKFEGKEGGGFRDVPSVSVTGVADADDEEMEEEVLKNPFKDGDDDDDVNEKYDIGVRGLGVHGDEYSTRPSLDADTAYYSDRAGLKGKEFI